MAGRKRARKADTQQEAAREESSAEQRSPSPFVPASQRFMKVLRDGDARPLRVWCHPSLLNTYGDRLIDNGATLVEDMTRPGGCEIAIFPRFVDLIQDDFDQIRDASSVGITCVIEDWISESLEMPDKPGSRKPVRGYLIDAPVDPSLQVDPSTGLPTQQKRPRHPITKDEMAELVWAIAENERNVSAGIRQVVRHGSLHLTPVWQTHYKKNKVKYQRMILTAEEMMQDEVRAKERDALQRARQSWARPRRVPAQQQHEEEADEDEEEDKEDEEEEEEEEELPVLTRQAARAAQEQEQDEEEVDQLEEDDEEDEEAPEPSVPRAAQPKSPARQSRSRSGKNASQASAPAPTQTQTQTRSTRGRKPATYGKSVRRRARTYK